VVAAEEWTGLYTQIEREGYSVSVYEELGGEAAIALAVDSFYERMLGDDTLAHWFEGMDMVTLKDHQRAFLTVALGGPEQYDGRSMRNAHSGLGITDADYTRTIGHLADALTSLGVAPDLVAVVTRRIELMRAAIVEVR
jgi:hemoglobin